MSKMYKKKLHKISEGVQGWDEVIADAEKLIQEHKSKVRLLRESIRNFQRLKETNFPFPSAKTELSEAKSDVAQK